MRGAVRRMDAALRQLTGQPDAHAAAAAAAAAGKNDRARVFSKDASPEPCIVGFTAAGRCSGFSYHTAAFSVKSILAKLRHSSRPLLPPRFRPCTTGGSLCRTASQTPALDHPFNVLLSAHPLFRLLTVTHHHATRGHTRAAASRRPAAACSTRPAAAQARGRGRGGAATSLRRAQHQHQHQQHHRWRWTFGQRWQRRRRRRWWWRRHGYAGGAVAGRRLRCGGAGGSAPGSRDIRCASDTEVTCCTRRRSYTALASGVVDLYDKQPRTLRPVDLGMRNAVPTSRLRRVRSCITCTPFPVPATILRSGTTQSNRCVFCMQCRLAPIVRTVGVEVVTVVLLPSAPHLHAGPLLGLPTFAAMPSSFQRHWLRYGAVGVAAAYGGLFLVRHSRLAGSDDLERWVLSFSFHAHAVRMSRDLYHMVHYQILRCFAPLPTCCSTALRCFKHSPLPPPHPDGSPMPSLPYAPPSPPTWPSLWPPYGTSSSVRSATHGPPSSQAASSRSAARACCVCLPSSPRTRESNPTRQGRPLRGQGPSRGRLWRAAVGWGTTRRLLPAWLC